MTYNQSTRRAFILTWVCNTPFWAIYNMLPFILYKDLHATPFQVTVAVALKPLVALFSMYWSAWIRERKDRLLSNVMWGTLLGHLPFFFFPFVDNPWFFIASFGFYMLMARGTYPAWMELLKLNVPKVVREKTFALASSFEYVGAGILPFLFGWLLDSYMQPWRWIFPLAALFSLVAIFFQKKIPKDEENREIVVVSWREVLGLPWKNAWNVLVRRPDFFRFQIGFMLGGAGLIIMQPALPQFFLGQLQLSYMELAIALTLCKGIGFALASPLWAGKIHEMNLFRFCSAVTLLAALFPLGLIAAKTSILWLYAAYFIYGVMQAGSTLSWNLSGPIFAKEEDSSVYSSVNIMAVGIRGCFIPAIGSALAGLIDPAFVMLLGGFLCFLATLRMFTYGNPIYAVSASK